MPNFRRISTKAWLLVLVLTASLGSFLTVFLVGCASDSGGIIGVCDSSPPTVISTIALDSATGVSVDADITASFSEEMYAETVNGASMTLDCLTSEHRGQFWTKS